MYLKIFDATIIQYIITVLNKSLKPLHFCASNVTFSHVCDADILYLFILEILHTGEIFTRCHFMTVKSGFVNGNRCKISCKSKFDKNVEKQDLGGPKISLATVY